MPDGIGGMPSEIGQAIKQQGQGAAKQIGNQITGNNPQASRPANSGGIDLVDFSKDVKNQLGTNQPAKPTSGLGGQLFGPKKPVTPKPLGAGGLGNNKLGGLGDLFGGGFGGEKNPFGFGPKKPAPKPAAQMPDFSQEQKKTEQNLEEVRKELFNQMYGKGILDVGKTDERQKQQEEQQKLQEEEQKRQEEKEIKAEEAQSLELPTGKAKQGMLGQPRVKKGGFNFMKWLKPKRQSNESNSGSRA